jgi:Leucine-rich repeat (LRR) protein
MSELALQLIAENKAKRERGEDATYLDLGRCGLTKLPAAIKELIWLETLILSDQWWEYNFENHKGIWQNSRNQGDPNKIISIKGVEKLVSLKKLVVAQISDESGENKGRKLKDLSHLREMSALQILDCSDTQVSDLSPLQGLSALQILKCSYTQVSDLSPLQGLSTLQILRCSDTQVSDLSPMQGLSALQQLDCSDTQVSDLSPLQGLSALQQLFLPNTQVSDLSPLQGLNALQVLYCYSTQVSDLSPLKGLSALQILDCDDTQVSDLLPLKGISTLERICCSNTKVTDLSPLQKMSALEQIYCSNTKVSDLSPLSFIIGRIPVKWQDFLGFTKHYPQDWANTPAILVKDCPLINPPIEIAQQGSEAILSYWEQIEKQGAGTLNEAKLIIVGEGKTGKTTLYNKLIDPEFDLQKNPTNETHGINIHEGLAMQEDFRANLWDFGGQELQYMTHQFFLSPKALYVLIMEARAEAPNLAYWFKIISLLGKGKSDEKVSLLIVLNKRKGSTGMPQYQDLLKLYEEDFDYQFLEVDFSENDARWECLKEEITKRLFDLPIVKNALPKQWKPIREALREESKERSYITTDRLSAICTEFGVTVEAEQWQMTDYLHQLGSLLHFQNDPDLMDLVILRPEWAVEGVYTTLKSDMIKEVQKGKFTAEDIFNILRGKGYSNTDAQKILKLMSKNNFDICYESENKGHFVAAQLLPDNAPVYSWFPKNVLQFRYQYPIMPKGLMSRLIVRLSDAIEQHTETSEQIVWKKGVILRIKSSEGECRVRLREDDAESKSGLRQITIEVMGDRDARKYALHRVRDAVEELHRRWFRNIKADEMVPCQCGECLVSDEPQLYKLADLIKLKLKRSTTVCYISGDDVPIQLLLEGVYDTAEIRAMEHPKSK